MEASLKHRDTESIIIPVTDWHPQTVHKFCQFIKQIINTEESRMNGREYIHTCTSLTNSLRDRKTACHSYSHSTTEAITKQAKLELQLQQKAHLFCTLSSRSEWSIGSNAFEASSKQTQLPCAHSPLVRWLVEFKIPAHREDDCCFVQKSFLVWHDWTMYAKQQSRKQVIDIISRW